MKTYKIEIAVDHCEAHEFAQWLNDHGHDAHVGNGTSSYVDGVRTSHDDDANMILNALWDMYCN